MVTADDLALFSRISRFQRLYAKALAKRLDVYGVKPGYIDIFTRLWERDNVTQKHLHAQLEIEQATLSNTIKRMERDGFVEKSRNPKDRRVTYIQLTERGQSMKRAVSAAIEDLQASISTGLTINDRRYFHRILKQMIQHAKTDLDDVTLVLVDEVSD